MGGANYRQIMHKHEERRYQNLSPVQKLIYRLRKWWGETGF